MSPLADAAVRGYPDMQRIDNWDSPQLYGHPAAVQAGNEATPILDVSRYGYLGGMDFTLDTAVVVTATWFLDAAGTFQIGARNFVLVSNGFATAQYRLPNLGPFVQVSWNSIGGGNFTHGVRLIGTNRVHPLEFVPSQSLLLDRQNVALAAGATDTLYPGDYYAGPVTVWYNANGASGLAWAEYLTVGGAWHQVAQLTTTAAGNNTFTWTMPAGAWRFNVKNTTAGTVGYFLAVTPSTTGAI